MLMGGMFGMLGMFMGFQRRIVAHGYFPVMSLRSMAFAIA